MDHQHKDKVLEFGFNEKHDWIVVKYGCTECDVVLDKPFPHVVFETGHKDHTTYVDGCFGCKIGTLELSTGDAGRSDSMSDKKWTAELDAYADARSQGIQPAGTTMKAVAEAKEASDKLGVAFNAESMPAASKITKQSAKVMKETGVV